jgi:hypothetical protein
MRAEHCHKRNNDKNFADAGEHGIRLVKNFTKSNGFYAMPAHENFQSITKNAKRRAKQSRRQEEDW